MTNDARSSISGSKNITMGNLYKALPFDNEIYIFSAKGSDIIKEYNYFNAVYSVTNDYISDNSYYTIAVIDYLAVHQNLNIESTILYLV